MNLSVLKFTLESNVAIVSINNPPINALSLQFLNEFDAVLDHLGSYDAQAVDRPRALLLTSEIEGFFSTGDDLAELKDLDDELIAQLPRVHAQMDAIEALPIPTVASINGHALGGGLELALCCDFRFMAEDSGVVGLPEIRLGMIPAFGGSQRLLQLVGKTKATEMMIKGLQIAPQEAKALGIINEVYAADELYAKSLDYAQRLALQATGAIDCIKQCIRAGLAGGSREGLAKELEVFKVNITREDAREGVDAFLGGRKPEFKGY